MPTPRNRSLIHRPPDHGSGADLRSSAKQYDAFRPPQPDYETEPADEGNLATARQNATAFLGPNREQNPALDPSEAGTEGLAMAAVAGAVQNVRSIANFFGPGAVWPEVVQWLDYMVQNAPQLAQQRNAAGTAAGAPAKLGGASPFQSQPAPAPPPQQGGGSPFM